MEKFIIVRCADSERNNPVKLGKTHDLEKNLEGVLLPVEVEFINWELSKARNGLEVRFDRMLKVVRRIVKGNPTEDIFLKWLEELSGSGYTTPVPNQFRGQKVFHNLCEVMKQLDNPSESLVGDLIRTSEGHYVFTMTLGSKVIFQDLVEPIYQGLVEEVDQTPPQLETPDQPEPLGQEEVEVEIDQVDLVEETPLLSVIECEVIASPEEEEAVGTIAVTAPVIPHWQKYSVNNGLNKW